jgi:hypothetical protein
MGIKAIQRKLEVPVSTLHYWLKDHPLSDDEQKAISKNANRYVPPKKDIELGSGFPCEVASRLTTIELGAIGESAILYRLCLMGLISSVSFSDGDVVDLYVRGRNGGQRVAFVQVRMASRSGPTGLPKISLRRNSNGKTSLFKPGDMHFLVGFCMENQSAYVYSYDEVSHLRNCITVTPDAHEAWGKLHEWLGSGRVTDAVPSRSDVASKVAQPRRRSTTVSARTPQKTAKKPKEYQIETSRYRAARGR